MDSADSIRAFDRAVELRTQSLERGEELAEQARRIADIADRTADLLERNAERGDSERRLAMAAWEREVASVERFNASRLASHAWPLGLRTPPPPPAQVVRPD